MKVFHRSPGNYDPMEATDACATRCEDESKTIQSDAVDADINTIVRRFGITGMMPQRIDLPRFEDFGDEVFDFRTAVERVAMAQDAFLSVPAEIRAKFENDPQRFMDFVYDPKNADELTKMGLREPLKEVIPPIVKVEVVNTPADKPA